MRHSKWFRILITWVIVLCVAVIGIELISLAVKYNDYKSQAPPTDQPSQPSHNGDSSGLKWGVDTASTIDQSNYQCISKNYGSPVFAGRYLGNNGDVSTGLTKDEVKFLHDKKVKILPIHNHFTKATGLKNGQAEAKEAIKLAKDVGVKEGVVLAADIEPKFPVDADFLIGWTKTMLDNHYKPGVYGDFGNKDLKNAYAEASKKDKAVKENLILWTNQPSIGVTSKKKAPDKFKGTTPNGDQTLAWQYGIESKKCNIDTDIGKGSLLDVLW